MPTDADHSHDEAAAIEPPATNTVPRALHVKLLQRDRIAHRVASMADPQQFTGVSSHQLEVTLLQLERHYDNFQRLQDTIELEDEDAFEHSHRDDFEDTYCEVKAFIAQQLDAVRVSPPQPHNSTVLSSSSRRVNLPKLQLPKFGGNPKEWLEFHNMFQVLVHENGELSNIEKFQYLRSCLTDKAAKLIQSLEVTAANYAKAVELLTTRYNNQRYIFTAHLQEIFDIKKIQNPTVPALRDYVDVVNANLRALQSLATSQQITDVILLQLVTAKLDPDTQSKWEEEVSKIMDAQSTNNSSRLPTWADLSLFMERRCQTLNLIDCGRTSTATRTAPSKSSTPKQTKVTLVNSTSSKCDLCNETPHHNPFKCHRFKALDTMARYQQAKTANLCLNCLTPGHVSNRCPSTKRCQTCGGSHHTLLHRQQETNSQPRLDAALTVDSITTHHSAGNVMQARALLDSASQLNFITEHVAQQLRVRRVPTHLEVAGIAQKSTAVRHTASVTIGSLADGYTASINAVIIPTITSNQPQRVINTSDWSIPPNVRLADKEFNTPGPIDVLIGASLFFNLMLVGQIQVQDVVFQKTHLGWIDSGECQQSSPPKSSMPYKSFITTSEETLVDHALERFWTLEDTPTHSSPPFTQEESQCEQFFEETVRRCPTTGKFIVRLPFKQNSSALGQSVDTANKRLSSLQARLRRNPNLHQQYVAFLNEYTELQHMELCTAEYTRTHTINYIPHHCVVKDDSSTTKLRVVFDASCRTSGGKSLNDVVMVGPTLQDDLITILMRFRRHAYVIMADIAKMYRQVWVDEQDTNFQCILWNDNPTEKPSTYRLKTITYGTSCAPYLAIKCLRSLAEQHIVDLPIGATATLQDFYVDNLMSGGSTINEVIDLRNQVITLLNHGGFPLRKFASNNTAILEDIDPHDQEEIVQLDGVDYVKALGLKWAPREDWFLFHYSPQGATKHTSKRSILSHIATFVDPLGLLNPVIVSCKILMQELWKLKLQWDESVPQLISTEWETIKSEMDHLARLRIPRKHLHAGAQTLHNILRGTFWIINARSTIKKLLRQCIICVRCRPILAQQLLGNLPTPRVEMAQPFETCGVDFCGPFMYTQKIRRHPPIKVYLSIFICFTTKAVHMELVPDLTTAAFIAALRRFIARRGKCHTIFSDNATNFVGADREIRDLLKNFTTQQHMDEVVSACTNEGIDWKFIPPRSPHFGGLWESAVKQAKYFLRRTIGRHVLSWDELNTLCCQVEAIINSRPLTALSSDPNDLQPLTPAHFLIGRALTAILEPSLPIQDSLRRYQLVQALQQQFWRRWHREYLHELQQRQKWKSPTPNLQPGDIVILKEDGIPPFKWPLGLIQKTISGEDSLTRVVIVKTKNGTHERAITKVCKLPTNEQSS